MEEVIVRKIELMSKQLVSTVANYPSKRDLFYKILKVDPEFFVGIKGLRGVGKTTLMLQLAPHLRNSVYFSADHYILSSFDLYETINTLSKRGYTNILIDEIHTRPDWQKILKSVYDERKVRVFFSGSSYMMLDDMSSDLSRRVVLYDLPPLSFREFLGFFSKRKYLQKVDLATGEIGVGSCLTIGNYNVCLDNITTQNNDAVISILDSNKNNITRITIPKNSSRSYILDHMLLNIIVHDVAPGYGLIPKYAKVEIELYELGVKQKLTIEEIIEKKRDYTLAYLEAYDFFADYLKYGGVLYPLEEEYYGAVVTSIEKTIKSDISLRYSFSTNEVNTAMKMMYFFASSKAGELSVNNLADVFAVSRRQIENTITALETASLIKRVEACGAEQSVRKERKLYLPFLYRYALSQVRGEIPDIGVLREEFFVNHIGNYDLCYPKGEKRKPDFMHKKLKRIFEVGGESKKSGQGADYLVVDSTSFENNKIPLFLFGFLY